MYIGLINSSSSFITSLTCFCALSDKVFVKLLVQGLTDRVPHRYEHTLSIEGGGLKSAKAIEWPIENSQQSWSETSQDTGSGGKSYGFIRYM